jgi:hypothetical protein
MLESNLNLLHLWEVSLTVPLTKQVSEDRIVAVVMHGVIASSVLNQARGAGEVSTGRHPSHGSHIGLVIGSATSSLHSQGSSVSFDPSQLPFP